MPGGKLKYVAKDNVDLNTFFGFVELDIEVPSHLYNYFSEFSPIVKIMEYSRDMW